MFFFVHPAAAAAAAARNTREGHVWLKRRRTPAAHEARLIIYSS